MSIHVASGAGVNYLSSNSNLSNPQSFTKLIWVKHDSGPTGYNDLTGAANAAVSAGAVIISDTGDTAYVYDRTTFTALPGSPTFTDWICYAVTGTTAGSTSLIGYWQDNAGGGWNTASGPGVNFTNFTDYIFNDNNVGMTGAYYMEWNTVLTSTQLSAQFLSSTPLISSGLERYLIMAASASAGTDTSGNGYNMTVNGTITTGSGAPTFPSVKSLLSGSTGGF